jgi:hypothetical protein
MHVERYEKIFMALTLVVLLAALAAIGAGVFAAGVHLRRHPGGSIPRPSGRRPLSTSRVYAKSHRASTRP